MTNAQDLAAFKRTPDVAFVVTAWHVNYTSDPKLCTGFFQESMRDRMEAFTQANSAPPEMACMQPIASYDASMRKCVKACKQSIAHAETYIDSTSSR